tara:strand:- start:5164 stop:6375 length:1212 start_codon:yes stop_codon:yes gene_type:complete
MNEILVSGSDIIILAILVLWLGNVITNKIGFLRKYSIPVAVTGGLLCSIVVAVIDTTTDTTIKFDMHLRDTLLLVFFTTIGISAKFSRLKAGGKALAILTVCAFVFLILQDITGVLLVKLFGGHPAMGLFAGSMSLAGGHGTAIAWGKEAVAAGLTEAKSIGIAFATFGLVTGGIIGGPIAEALIKRHNLSPSGDGDHDQPLDSDEDDDIASITLESAFSMLFVLAVCLSFGELVNRWLFHNDIKLPGFLTAMMVGIAITNYADRRKKPLPVKQYDGIGTLALQLFLAMSLMSMDLTSIADSFGMIFVILNIQAIVLTLFAVLVIFRVMGRDYDAAVVVAGFCGLGMGATPVAMANMSAVTQKYGVSFKAFLVIPLVGAFFIDLLNALVIKLFIGLPIMQAPV